MLKPYYQSRGVTVYHGDCEETIPQLETDIVVTSPPYNTLPSSGRLPGGIHGRRKSGVNKFFLGASQGYFDQREEGEYQRWLSGIVSGLLEISKGLVWVNHKIRYRDGVALHPVRFLDFPIYSEVV